MTDKQCFANYHMTVAQYGLWEHARTISFKRGRLLFDGRKMAARFVGTGKDAFYLLAKQLTKKGWFEIIDENLDKKGRRKRDKNGHYLPTIYRVLSHDEWAEKYGANTCPQNATGDDDQSLNPDTSSPYIQTRPVPKTRHKSVGEHSDGDHSDANLIEEPVPKTRQVNPDKTLKVHDSARADATPVPKSRQVVYGTQFGREEIFCAKEIAAGRMKPEGILTAAWAKEVLKSIAAQVGSNA
jgi:hypothetical protein